MKKTSVIVKEKNTYDIYELINNTAYIKSITGKTGLLNIKSNEIIGNMDYYHTTYSSKFYYQTKEIQKSTNSTPQEIIRIYDALNENMIADGWEVVQSFKKDQDYAVVSLRSSIDGKIHLYDRYAYRKPTNIFDMALDNVEELYSEYNDIYLVVTLNGKKGLYYNNCYDKVPSLVTPIEYDNIEKMPNIIVFTKGNEKYFIYVREDEKKSELFNTISIDEKNKNIAYCRKTNTIYVYNTKSQELLLKTDCDEIKFIKKDDNYYHDEFFFTIKQNDKMGLISSKINNKMRNSSEVTTLLQLIYDDIKYEDDCGCETFYLEKDKKVGIFLGNSYYSQLINPEYDKINYLRDCYYAFYKGEYCDIGSVNCYIPYKLSIANCKIEENLSRGLIYKKDDLFGLLLSYDDEVSVIPNKYEKISCIGKYYFVLEQNGKKGVLHLGETIIPIEYEDIAIGGYYPEYSGLEDAKTVYFALKKGEKEYELAKRINDNGRGANKVFPVKFVSDHTFEEVNFFKDIMVFKDSTYVYVYNYEQKLLKIFQSSTLIIPFAKLYNECGNKKHYKDHFYCVDGTYYYYEDGKFEEAFVEENDLYVTTYETDTDSFEAKTLNKKEHDEFCDYIDKQSDDLAEQSLVELSSDAKTLKKRYPTLVLRKVEKNKNPKETS